MEKFTNNPRLKKAGGILLIIVLIILIIVCINKYNKWKRENPVLLNRVRSAKRLMKIPAKKVQQSKVGAECSYSFWMFIEDWQYKINEFKPVLFKGDKNAKSVAPGIWLYPYSNKLMVRMATHFPDTKNDYLYPGYNAENGNGGMNPRINDSLASKDGTQYVCDIPNIPLQRWVHVAVVVFNRTVDVYINGKLARSCILQGEPLFNDGDLYINDDPGFGGYMSCVRYSDKALDPRKVYSLYEQGPNCSSGLFKNLNYKLQVQFGKTDDWEDASSASITL